MPTEIPTFNEAKKTEWVSSEISEKILFLNDWINKFSELLSMLASKTGLPRMESDIKSWCKVAEAGSTTRLSEFPFDLTTLINNLSQNLMVLEN
jgi:hypothetical protein